MHKTLIDQMQVRELYVKLELLDWQENIINEIQGVLTGGNVNLNGNSSVRRTASFSFLSTDKTIESQIKLNTKFKLYIGLKNRLPKGYEYLGDIIWFKQGTFVFINATYNHTSANTTISVSAKDKMCLLNGEIGGTIPDTVIFHERIESVENDVIIYGHPLIFQIIQEMVNHYGGEDLAKIRIEDVPLQIRQLLQWNGTRPIYFHKESYQPTFNPNNGDDFYMFTVGEAIGYQLTEFTYPGELISKPGDSVCTILDKIKNVLGNFEYFYDIDGNFVFREIRNYQNKSYVPLKELENGDYQANFNIEEIVYSFKKNRKLITSFNNNPKYGNIKNDYVVWGVRKTATGAELPIRYHLAIDDKPSQVLGNESEEWRERLYQIGQNAQPFATDAGYYAKEMNAEWRKLYKPESGYIDAVENDPASLDYWIDFIDTNSEYGKWSVSNIGRRTIAVQDKDCTCVFTNEIPDVIFAKSQDEADQLRIDGYNPSVITDQSVWDAFRISGNRKSCYDKVRELMYQHLTINESITIQALPIYWLDVNSKIEVEDDDSQIYGDYMIQSISLPLTYNGTMSIQASRALKRL